MSALTVRALELNRGTRPSLRGVDLDVDPGEVCAFMGVSGAGKSTLLRAIAALEAISAGTITIGNAGIFKNAQSSAIVLTPGV